VDDFTLTLSHEDVPAITWAHMEAHTVLHAWWHGPINDDWAVAFRLVLQEGQPVVGEVRVFPNELGDPDHDNYAGQWSAEVEGSHAQVPVRGVTSAVLKQVKLSALESLPDVIGWVRTQQPAHIDNLARHELTPEMRGRMRRGPKGPSDKQLAGLARAYVDLVSGDCANPNEVLAKRRKVKPQRIRDLIHAARNRGILSPATRGRRGGYLTEWGQSLLDPKTNRDK
jgi:hypothetical protein